MKMEDSMTIGLFVPCYVDQFYPDVAVATYWLLKRYGFDIEYPKEQTCCGQPLYNSGFFDECGALAKKFVKLFENYDVIVAPSGSCISMVKHNYAKLGIDDKALHGKLFELVEFLHAHVSKDQLSSRFNAVVGLHNSCHAHRELELASPSECNMKSYSKILDLLDSVEGITVKQPKRMDECCGFGGTFSINEPDISARMGNDRLREHLDNGVEYITAVDISCLMHLQGLIDRQKLPLKTIHIAQILAGDPQ
jgi:L-lactate dehydrogenase complex protein LldE